MVDSNAEQIRKLLDSVYREESSRILATLIRLLGDFDLAEEAMQDAFAAALERWSKDGAPENPRAWLISTAIKFVATVSAQTSNMHVIGTVKGMISEMAKSRGIDPSKLGLD